jgi:YVTN family beta-propeller protein
VLEFRILGPLEVVEQQQSQQQRVVLGGPKQRAVVAILLLRRGELVSSERLIDQLWGERPPPTAAKTLQSYVSRLRKALGNDVLVTRNGGYVLAAAPGQVDAERFEEIVAEARHALADGDAAHARELLDSALALWRGEALGDLAYESFAQGEILRLDEMRLGAIEDRIDAELALGHHRELLGELESLIAQHPRRERLYGQLMLALYRSGRQSDALDVYRRARRTLGDELGLEPGPELRALEQRILTHDPTLGPPEREPRAREITGRSRPPRARLLLLAGGAVLIAAAIAAAIVALTGGGATVSLRAAPNSLAAIDPHTNHVVGQVAVGTRPSGIASAAGSLWVANLDDQTVSRVDPRAPHVLRNIPVTGPPTGITSSAGRVWLTEASDSPGPTASSILVRTIDPEFDTLGAPVRIGNVAPNGQAAVAANGNAVWAAPSWGLLTRLDARTGHAQPWLDPNASPSAMAIGEGAIWLTDTEANDVVRVDPTTRLLTQITVGNAPTGIAVGAGAVWVIDSLDNAIVRIDPDSRSVTATIPVGQSPAGIAFGAGSVWAANAGDGTVTRIDPTTGMRTTIQVGGSPQAITIANGKAWVSVDAQSIPPTTGDGAGGGTLRIVSSYDIGTVDPAFSYGAPEYLSYATCAKLVNYPDKAGLAGSQLTPEVAQALPARSADGRTYTFRIRRGFRFSPPSGQPVTAQTFKDTIERTLNPQMHNPLAHYLADIVGARPYMAGTAAHIAGVVAHGDVLTISLRAPEPDFLARLAEPVYCAVPPATPVKPDAVRVIPSAGPYYVASYTPGQGAVLIRNPNYQGNRPRHFARIELAIGRSGRRALAAVQAGTADYTNIASDSLPPATAGLVSQMEARFGPESAAAAQGTQRYFVNPGQQLDFFFLNTHRPLFRDVRMRQAVNYAIDRRALARQGDLYEPLPERPTDHYLPPGVPGFRNARVYPTTPDVARARALAHGRRGTAVFYTCSALPCQEQAQIVKTDLAAIGLHVQVKSMSSDALFAREARPGEPFDLAWDGWVTDYPDPSAMLSGVLEDSSAGPTFDDPGYRHRLAAAARLSGPARYLAFGKLDLDLARNAAPLAAFGNLSSNDFFSARIGCQTYGVYGIDLGALCLRHPRG